jgi:DNA (cytosine-5)-methyltransferase 1
LKLFWEELMSRRPIAVDIFAGYGGLSIGFEQGGFDLKAAVEIDPVHGCVHKFNLPNCVVIPRSISELTAKDIRELSGIGSQTIDCVIGGSPCQSFSLSGLRSLKDPRSLLMKEFLRIVLELKPSYFVFENVKGLTIGEHKRFLDELIEGFKQNGYSVLLPWKILNAANYGVPQKRERLFLLGAKKGLALPNYPSPSTRLPGDKKADPNLPHTPTCFDALGDLPEAEDFEELVRKDSVQIESWKTTSNYGKQMRCLDENSWHFGYRRNWNPSLLTSSIRTNHTQQTRARFSNAAPGKIEPISRFFKLAENGVANTLRAGTDATRGAHTSPRSIHYSYPRCITVREMARLHGCPDWIRLHSTKWYGARQIGNSVPIPLARAIALEIIKCLEITPTSPIELLELGDPDLLSMTMTQAAKYWQIQVPIQPRKRLVAIDRS